MLEIAFISLFHKLRMQFRATAIEIIFFVFFLFFFSNLRTQSMQTYIFQKLDLFTRLEFVAMNLNDSQLINRQKKMHTEISLKAMKII